MIERVHAIWRGSAKRRLIAGGLDVAALLARAGLLNSARGRGAIFTLHHVRPHRPRPFAPNAHLEITPEFLDAAITRLAEEGYNFIPLSEVPARLASGLERPFAAFTLDDGYRNNAKFALPVFARHEVPFTVFVTQGFAERTQSLWWETLGELLGHLDEASFDFGVGPERLDLSTQAQKLAAFRRFSRYIWEGDEAAAISAVDEFARQKGLEPLAITGDLVMDADELKALAAHPLASLGAHTVSHRATGRLSTDEARQEMQQSADWVKRLTGRRPETFAFPYGTREAVSERDETLARGIGFSVAVTTRPGTLDRKNADRLTALPRISLNGYYQQSRYVSALASGIPFAIAAR